MDLCLPNYCYLTFYFSCNYGSCWYIDTYLHSLILHQYITYSMFFCMRMTLIFLQYKIDLRYNHEIGRYLMSSLDLRPRNWAGLKHWSRAVYFFLLLTYTWFDLQTEVASLASECASCELLVKERKSELERQEKSYEKYRDKMRRHAQVIREFESTLPHNKTLKVLEDNRQQLTEQGLSFQYTIKSNKK